VSRSPPHTSSIGPEALLHITCRPCRRSDPGSADPKSELSLCKGPRLIPPPPAMRRLVQPPGDFQKDRQLLQLIGTSSASGRPDIIASPQGGSPLASDRAVPGCIQQTCPRTFPSVLSNCEPRESFPKQARGSAVPHLRLRRDPLVVPLLSGTHASDAGRRRASPSLAARDRPRAHSSLHVIP